MRPDTVIVGAGIIGLSIARELHKRGERNIVVLDRGTAGSEASWAAAGMLSPQAEADRVDTFFRFCSEARDLYPAFADELLEETGFDIELDQTGTISAAFTESELNELGERLRWQTQTGLEVTQLASQDLRELEPHLSKDVLGGLLFKNDWQVENRRVLRALLEYSTRNGVAIREHTEVRKLLLVGDRITGVETGSGNIECSRVILTAGAWTSLIKPKTASIQPIRGQMMAFVPNAPVLDHVVYGAGGYLVPRRDGRLLVGATVENVGFDRTVTDEAVKSLRDTALEIIPGLANVRISESWAGLRPMSTDGLPVLGPIQGIDGLVTATGHYRNGILLAPLTAKLIADVLNNRSSEYLDAYGAARFADRSAGVSF